jgi:hypothetical protein
MDAKVWLTRQYQLHVIPRNVIGTPACSNTTCSVILTSRNRPTSVNKQCSALQKTPQCVARNSTWTLAFCGPQQTITKNPTRPLTVLSYLTMDIPHTLLSLTVPLDMFGSSLQSPRNPPSIFLWPLCLNLVVLKVTSGQIRGANWPGVACSDK